MAGEYDMLEKIFVILRVIRIKLKNRKNVNYIWPGYQCGKVLFDSDKSICLNIDKSAMFSEGCILKIREGANLTIGKNCFFNNNCFINVRCKLDIGNNTIFGPGVVIVDNDHDYHISDFGTNFLLSEIKIGNNVWVGANAIILRGSIIEDGAIIAAGTIVKDHVEENTMVYQKRNYEKKKIIRS